MNKVGLIIIIYFSPIALLAQCDRAIMPHYDGTVSILSLENYEIIDSIKIDGSPIIEWITVNQEGSKAYFIAKNGDTLFEFDIPTATITRTLDLFFSRSVESIVYSKSSNEIYISDIFNSTIVIVDINSFEISGNISTNTSAVVLASSSDGNRIYYSGNYELGIGYIDPISHQLIKMSAFSTCPESIVISADDEIGALASCRGIHTFGKDFNSSDYINIPGGIRDVEFSLDGKTLFASSLNRDNFFMLSAAPLEIQRSYTIAKLLYGINVTPSGDRVLIGHFQPEGVSVFNTRTYEVDTVIQSGGVLATGLGNIMCPIEISLPMIPTLSTWGIICLSLLLCIISIQGFKRYYPVLKI